MVTLGGIIFEPDERCNDSAESRRLIEESGGRLESIHDHIRNLKEGRRLPSNFKRRSRRIQFP